MPFDPWPWHRRRQPQPTPEPLPALPFLDQQVADFENTPMGGDTGEAFTIPPDPPANTASGGLVIEPPVWSDEPYEPEPEPGPELTALEAMKAAAGEYEPAPWQPAPTTEPIPAVVFPEVESWRAVEAEQAHLKGKP